MSKVRYKIRREQLERVVEHFVMESAMIEKNAAKKHKMSMGAEQSDDMGDGMIPAKEVKNPKMKQAPEVKKHMHGKVNESVGSSELRKVATELSKELKSELTDEEKRKLKQLVSKIDFGQEISEANLMRGLGLSAVGVAGLATLASFLEPMLKSKGIELGGGMGMMDFLKSLWEFKLLIPFIASLGITGIGVRDVTKSLSAANKEAEIKRLEGVINNPRSSQQVKDIAQKELDKLMK